MALVLFQDHTFEKKSHMDPSTTISFKLPAYVPLTSPHIDTGTIFVLLSKTTSTLVHNLYSSHELKNNASLIVPFFCSIINFPYPAGSYLRP